MNILQTGVVSAGTETIQLLLEEALGSCTVGLECHSDDKAEVTHHMLKATLEGQSTHSCHTVHHKPYPLHWVMAPHAQQALMRAVVVSAELSLLQGCLRMRTL